MVDLPSGSIRFFSCFVFVKLFKLPSQLRKHFSYTFNNDLIQKYKEIGPASSRSICYRFSRKIWSRKLPVSPPPPPQAPRDQDIGIA